MSFSPVQVTITVRTPATSRRVELALRAARPRLNLIAAKALARITRSNFGPSASPMRPTPWPPYKRTAHGKRKGDPATLIRTGFLLASITTSATNQTGMVTAQGARNYAAAHQFGCPHIGLPARPYFPVVRGPNGYQLYQPAEAEIVRILLMEIQRTMRGL